MQNYKLPILKLPCFFLKQGKKFAKQEASHIIIELLFSAFFAYKEAKTANLLSLSLTKRLILRKLLKSKQSLNFLVTIFSFHSIFSQGKNVDTDFTVTDFRVTVLISHYIY